MVSTSTIYRSVITERADPNLLGLLYETLLRINEFGGVEGVVKVTQTCSECQVLKERACYVLICLVCCSIGIAKAIESSVI
jgi:hypothetical protein